MHRTVLNFGRGFMFGLGLLGFATSAQAQRGYDPGPFVSRGDVALGYDYIRANAPPGGAPKFSANGAFGEVSINWKYWLGIAGEVTGSHANDISSLGQDLTLITYTAGPRVTFHYGKTDVFVQGLVGAAHGSDSYFPTGNTSTTSASSLAYSAGGGVDYFLRRSWGVRVQGEYLHTALPNGVNDSEHHLAIGAGLVYRFGGHFTRGRGLRAAPPPPEPAPEAAVPPPPPPPPPATSGPPVSNPPADALGAAAATPLVPPPPAPSAPNDAPGSRMFHDAVKDVYFEYDKYELNEPALSAIATAAGYLKQHTELNILIGGYADERGTVDYDLQLGSKRANAVKEALIAAGIDPGRLQVVSYGKGVQVCTENDEPCFRQNRRAAFMVQP